MMTRLIKPEFRTLISHPKKFLKLDKVLKSPLFNSQLHQCLLQLEELLLDTTTSSSTVSTANSTLFIFKTTR